ncbi:MAG: GNAT family N-acetyltransferase [Gemmataceae bacterium]|jgi:GNAT superfamily N-acetyltransferase|nr:GNAT family N-acetyltransferase [Gemmataceae bacterium]
MEQTTIRTIFSRADVQAVISLHAEIYQHEYGFNQVFADYVATALADYWARFPHPREELWIVEKGSVVCGSIALVQREAEIAQLRWFLLAAEVRGQGLGQLLLQKALSFARDRNYKVVQLWTVNLLTQAAQLYQKAGFVKIAEQEPHAKWGTLVSEQCYELRF